MRIGQYPIYKIGQKVIIHWSHSDWNNKTGVVTKLEHSYRRIAYYVKLDVPIRKHKNKAIFSGVFYSNELSAA